MNLYLRLLKLLLLLPFMRSQSVLAESRMSFRVWPNDCDLNFHMNNGRYLTFMDLGRIHLLAQAGMLRPLLQHGWSPVLSAAEISYIRPLAPFVKFTLHTRILTWDDKYFYLEQRFTRGATLCALATVRGLFTARGRPVSIVNVLRALGVTQAAPREPAVVSHWKELTTLKKNHSSH